MNARLTNQRCQLADYVYVKGNIVYFAESIMKKFRACFEKYNI